jgi:hypothetical protein
MKINRCDVMGLVRMSAKLSLLERKCMSSALEATLSHTK